MHLNLSYFALYTSIYRLTEREHKKTFPFTKLSMRNGRCENRLCARTPRARQGSVLPLSNVNEVLFYMLEINYITLIFVICIFLRKLFQKYKKH